jgi:hypothetical protein
MCISTSTHVELLLGGSLPPPAGAGLLPPPPLSPPLLPLLLLENMLRTGTQPKPAISADMMVM